ncbi:hypothetical protein WN48_05906 [Eufriesea mexicana]|uniref:Uncharacterized protein n=1 Tax=Eufriesea mexicana TaxID=516756 RepID=A0A310SKH7_9HYME|nr:hypothetical protein WN48_05906 [Eufriesea mexicana]
MNGSIKAAINLDDRSYRSQSGYEKEDGFRAMYKLPLAILTWKEVSTPVTTPTVEPLSILVENKLQEEVG